HAAEPCRSCPSSAPPESSTARLANQTPTKRHRRPRSSASRLTKEGDKADHTGSPIAKLPASKPAIQHLTKSVARFFLADDFRRAKVVAWRGFQPIGAALHRPTKQCLSVS